MNTKRILSHLVALFAAFLIAGCAILQTPTSPFSPYAAPWHGRLSIRVSPEPGHSQGQAFVAEFDLSGNEQTGELTLYGPLGSTAAAMRWTPLSATLRSNGEVRHFDSLNALVQEAVGTDLPVGALFAWVAGENKPVNGWRANLSGYPQGKIKAHRQAPAPEAELNLRLTR